MKYWMIGCMVCVAGAGLRADEPAGGATRPVAGTRFSWRRVQFEHPWVAHAVGEDLAEALKQSAASLAPKFGLDPKAAVAVQSKLESDQDHGSGTAAEAEGLVTVRLPGSAAAVSKEFAGALMKSLSAPLRERLTKKTVAQIESLEGQSRAYAAKGAEAGKEMKRHDEEMKRLSGQFDATIESINQAATKFREQGDQIELDMLAKDARRKAMQEAIADQNNKIAVAVKEDPIARELQKVVDARAKKSTAVEALVKSKAAAPTDAEQVNADLAEAMAKLLQRQHDAALEAGGAVLQRFNQELMTLSVDSRELEARRAFVQGRIDNLRKASEAWQSMVDAQAVQINASNQDGGIQPSLTSAKEQLRNLKEMKVAVVQEDDSEAPPVEKLGNEGGD